MADLTPLKVDELGTGSISFTTLTHGSAGHEGDEFTNTGKEFVVFKGHATVGGDVTFTAQVTNVRHPSYGNTTKANLSIAVDAAEVVVVGPFKPNAFNDSNNVVKMSCVMDSGSTGCVAKVCYLDDR